MPNLNETGTTPVRTFDQDRWRSTRDRLRSVLNDLYSARNTDYMDSAALCISAAFDGFVDYGHDDHAMWAFYLRWTPSPRSPNGHRFQRCGNCSDEAPRDFMCYDESQDSWYCASCSYNDAHSAYWPARAVVWYEPDDDFEEEEIYDAPAPGPLRGPLQRLFNYSSNPISTIGRNWHQLDGEKVNRSTRLFGCEIEFQCDTNRTLSDVLYGVEQQVGIYKSDGSLSEYPGAEYCTLPMTRAAVKDLEPILKRMIELGARAWNRPQCGLHVHVTQASASWPTWGKVERFFQNRQNQEFLNKVAGRKPNQYCRRGLNGDPRAIPVKQALLKARGVGGGDGHYGALNLYTGKPTVEFRLFRGNVAYHGVLRAIQFCDSLIEFADGQSNASAMDHKAYTEWLGQHAKAYPQLRRLLTGKDTGELVVMKPDGSEHDQFVETAA